MSNPISSASTNPNPTPQPYTPTLTKVHIFADGADSATSELLVPPSRRLLPQAWNVMQLRCRDASGNPTEVLEPSRLAIKCEGIAAQSHVQVRPRWF